MKLVLALAIVASSISLAASTLRIHRADPTQKLANGLQAELALLSGAVAQGDVTTVERITTLLLDEARRRAPQQDATVNTAVSNTTDVVVLPSVNTSHAQAPTSACLLDDFVFAMTPESKTELKAELQDPTMQEALWWTKAAGWWVCAQYGEVCNCHGDVRMVDGDHTVWTPSVNARPSLNQVHCSTVSFGGVDIKPGQGKMCECSHAADGSDFHLHKRLTSKTYLQEMWIFLLRLLGRTRMLPLGTGDRLHHGIENWAARHKPGTMPMVLERIWIEMFVKKVVLHHGPGTRCLEWGDPALAGKGFNYAFMLPQCTSPIDMQFDPVFYGQRGIGISGNIVYSDIDRLPAVLATGGDHRVNLIFATQVFEHIANPHHASQMLFNSLLPGGAIVFTAPQQAQFHLVPHDYFRYTKEGAVHVLQQAGFCVPKWSVAGGGDFVFDIARDSGLQVQDFPNEEITGAYQSGFDAVSDSAVTIHILAFKPPHAACAQAMPAIYR